jgi:hypothetical protein
MFHSFPKGDSLNHLQIPRPPFGPRVEELDWSVISADPSQIALIKQRIDLVDWDALANNPHPDVSKILKKRPL